MHTLDIFHDLVIALQKLIEVADPETINEIMGGAAHLLAACMVQVGESSLDFEFADDKLPELFAAINQEKRVYH